MALPEKLCLRAAEKKDLPHIIRLLEEDELGATREYFSNPLLQGYYEAFQAIVEDKNQDLLVVTLNDRLIATCHLTYMPSLSFQEAWRLNLENIHVNKKFQNQGVGTWMLQQAIQLGKDRNCTIIQLTTNKKRVRARSFYEKLGFIASHEGMKLYLGKHS